MPPPKLLVLWDIDHTLLETGGIGRDAYATAFGRATGVTLDENWRFDGRTESAAALEALAQHGLPNDAEAVRRLFDAIVAVHAEMADRFAVHSRALPGTGEAIAALADLEQARIYQSVLTGNLREVAAIKLAAVSLQHGLDLDIGAYGSDAVERSELAPYAFARAAEKLGARFDGPSTVIIGDTPRDIAAARAIGAFGIAVATGHHSAAALAAAGADAVLADLSDTAAFLGVLPTAGIARG